MIKSLILRVRYRLRRIGRRLEVIVRNLFGWVQSDEQLIDESRDHWNAPPSRRLKSQAHWKEGHAFDSPGVWDRLGSQHRELLLRAAEEAGLDKLCRVVDWGCGGGLNAVRIAADVQSYFGVDVSKQTLDECKRQVSKTEIASFEPILIDAADPEACLKAIDEPCDAFLCTYVFELLPSREYGWRIVRLAHSLLRPGGVALLHIRYSDKLSQQSRPWNYSRNLAHNTTFTLEEFRSGVAKIGFEKLFEEVIAKQDDLNERRYAFFALKRI